MEIKDIENLAELAKLELSQAEKESLLKDLDSILAYVKQVQEVDIPEDKEGLSVEYLNKNAWREDQPTPQEFSRDLIIGQFPDSQDGFLKVKKIL